MDDANSHPLACIAIFLSVRILLSLRFLMTEEKDMAMIICPGCRKSISNQGRECPNCGREITTDTGNVESSETAEEFDGIKYLKEQEENAKIVRGTVFGIAAFVCSIIAIFAPRAVGLCMSVAAAGCAIPCFVLKGRLKGFAIAAIVLAIIVIVVFKLEDLRPELFLNLYTE